MLNFKYRIYSVLEKKLSKGFQSIAVLILKLQTKYIDLNEIDPEVFDMLASI